MKKVIITLTAFFLAATAFSQSTSLWASYAILSLNGGANAYYDLNAVTANPDFQGAMLGSFTSANSLVVKGGQNHTNKCSGGNVTGSNIYYRVWLTSAGASGSFTTINEGWVSDNGGTCNGDQTWEGTGGATNVLTGLTPGNYTIEVYADAPGYPSTQTANNGLANYRATFNYCGATSGALPVGNYAIPGCFATVGTAVNYINANGVSGTGTVQFDVAAGGSEIAPAGGISITATGTSTTAIKFVKAAGAAYTITATTPQTSGNINDAIIKIIGGDYITIDGFTLLENASNATPTLASNNMTEFGVALFYTSTTNGAQNNTIQNCTISLNRTYSNTFGIYSSAVHSATSMTVSAPSTSSLGANSNNKFYKNTISNVNMGICLLGGSTSGFADVGNDIGGNSVATGNTFTNWGGQTPGSGYSSMTNSSPCIYENHQIGENISYNSMTSFAITSGVDLQIRGILKRYSVTQPTGTFTSTISNNTIALTTPFTTNYPVAIGSQDITTALSTATININNNIISSIAQTGAATVPTYGIYSANAAGTVNINGNRILGVTSAQTSGGYFGIQNVGAVVNALNINNNQIGNATTGAVTFSAATSGAVKGIETTGGASTCAVSIQNNNFQGFVHSVAGSSPYTFINSTATTLSQNISTDTFNNISLATTGAITFFTHTASVPATGTQTISNNRIQTAFAVTGAGGGTVYLFYSNGSSVAGAVINHQNNNFSNITLPAASNIQGWYNSDGGTPTKTFTGNTFSNWTGSGTGSIYGIYMNYCGANSSCSNNTITNISTATTASVYGIYIGSSAAGTTLSVSNNNISGVTTSGAAGYSYGIYFSGAATTNNLNQNTINGVGGNSTTSSSFGLYNGSTSGTINIYSNRINNIFCAGGYVYGVYNGGGGGAVNIYLDTIYNIKSTLASGNVLATAIYHTQAVSVTSNIYRNKIYDIGVAATTTCTAYGMSIAPGSSSTTNITNIYNNTISELTAPNAVWNLPSCIGIGILPSTTATSTSTNIYFNSIRFAALGAAGLTTSGIYVSLSGGATKYTMNDNLVVNNSQGLANAVSTYGTTELAQMQTTSNNNLYYAGTPGTSNNILAQNLGASITYGQTVCDYIGALTGGKELNSGTENVSFQSSDFTNVDYFRPNVSTPTFVESKGITISTPAITQDYELTTRNVTTPDIGALEGAYSAIISATPGVVTTQITGNIGKGSANQPIIKIAVTTGASATTLTQVVANTNGSTNVADLTNAKLWYGSTVATFNAGTMTQLGSTIASPSGVMTFNGFSQGLACVSTTFYLYITYDVPCTATGGNVIDAECTNITAGGSTVIPTPVAPAGNRTILGAMAGIYTIGTDYASIALAVADLNTRGISANTSIKIPAGYTETNTTAKGLVLNMSGTCAGTQPSATQTLRFEKTGAGANPILNAQVGGGTATPVTTSAATQLDGIFAISGTDYTTIDGLDLNDGNTANPATMEYGYAFFKNSVTDACQFDTIKNCTITMKTLNNAAGSTEFDGGSKAFWMGNTIYNAMGNALAITNVTGSHSNNVILNNTMTGAYEAIYLRGYSTAAYFDNNNTIFGNTITNFGNSATTPSLNTQAIYQIYNNNLTVSNNNIDNTLSGGHGQGSLYGIFLSTGGSSNMIVNNNTIKLIQNANSPLIGIQVAPTGKISIRYNTIQQCSQGASALAAFTGINLTGTTNTQDTVISNSVINNTGIRGQFTGINVAGATGAVVCDSNFVNSNTTVSTSTFTGINAGTSSVGNMSISNNQVNSNTGGASGFLGINFSMGTAPTLAVNKNQLNGNSVGAGSSSCYLIQGAGNGATPTSYSVSYNTVNGFTANSNTSGIYGYYNFASYAGSSNYKVSGNTFNNIQLTGSPSTATIYGIYDGNGGSPNKNIDSNTITNLGTTGTGTIYGVYFGFASTSTFNKNVITDLSTGGSIYGFSTASSPGTISLVGNKMCNFNATGSSSVVAGFSQSGGTSLTYFNNILGNFTAPSATVASTPYIAIFGFQMTAGSAAILYHNTVYLNASSSGTNFGTTAVLLNSSIPTTMKNNLFYNASTPSGSGRTLAICKNSNNTSNYASANNTNNRFWVGTPLGSGAGTRAILWDGTTSNNTINVLPLTAPYTGTEGNSDTSSVGFITTTCGNSNFLNVDTNSQFMCQISNKGVPLSAPYNVDIRGITRSAAAYPNGPDMGAYEYGSASQTWTGAISTDWNDKNNWCPKIIPTAASAITIPSGPVNQPVVAATAPSFAYAKTLTINTGASVTVNTGKSLQITQGGALTNNGTFTASAGSTVVFAGGGSGTSTLGGTSNTTLDSCFTKCGVDFGTNKTTINSMLRIDTGGYVTTSKAPIYAATSTLAYNTNGIFAAAEEWYPNTTSGAGVPKNVMVMNGGAGANGLSFGTATFPRTMTGNLTLNSGSTFALSTASGGDLNIAGTWTNKGATFTPNCRAVQFNGNGIQTVEVTGGGTETFNYLLLNNSGTFKPSATTGNLTDIKITESTCSGGAILQLLGSGTVDLNGRNLIVDNIDNVTNPDSWIYVNGTRTITNSAGLGNGSFAITGQGLNLPTQATVSVHNNSGTGSLIFDNTVNVTIADGYCDFGASGGVPITTIQGVLQVNLGGSVGTAQNACNYAVGSVLRFANTVDYQVNSTDRTWAAGAIFSGTAGIPYNVEVLNAGTDLTMNSVRALRNKLTITNGSLTLTNGLGNFNIGGDWTRNGGAFNPNNNRVVFDGTSNQTIATTGGVTSESFYELEASTSPGNLYLGTGTSVNVSNQLVFTSGTIVTGYGAGNADARMVNVTNCIGTAITGYGAGKYVNGKLQRCVGANVSYDLPVGNFNNYELANITFDAALAGTTKLVATFDSVFTGAAVDTGKCVINGSRMGLPLNGGFWTIKPDVQPTAGTYSATLYETGYGNAPSTANQMGLIKRDDSGADWGGCGKKNGLNQNTGTSVNSTQSISGGVAAAARSGVSSFSDFAIAKNFSPNIALPVKLISFTAEAVENSYIKTAWATATEINNKGFFVERSEDAVSFKEIGWVDGNGNTTETKYYTLNDVNASAGITYYYRLHQIDFDGNDDYSEIVSAILSKEGTLGINLYPVPAKNLLNVELKGISKSTVNISIYNMLGELVKSQQQEINNETTFPIDVTDLATGNYTISVVSNLNNINKKFTILK